MRCSGIFPPPSPERLNVEVWARVLMPNHVHPVLVPSDESGLAGAMSPRLISGEIDVSAAPALLEAAE